MRRPARGYVIKPEGNRRSFSLRFWAYGNREMIRLGRPEDGWTLEMAARELAVVLRDIDLGIWRSPIQDPAPVADADPTFHEFASGWFETKRLEIESEHGEQLPQRPHQPSAAVLQGPPTLADHDRRGRPLPPAQGGEAAEIAAAAEAGQPRMVEVVDRRGRRYRRPERALSPRSINMHLFLLAQILDVAVDPGHLPSNPARGKRRRLRAVRPRPVHLDSAEQIAVMLEAAAQLDAGERVVEVTDRRGRSDERRDRIQTVGRRAAIAVLLLGGGRVSATGAMRWRDIDLVKGRVVIGRDKTEAGMREVDMLPLLREILTEHKAASANTGPDDPVFITATGTPRSRHNLRQDVVEAVVRRAEEIQAERAGQPLPLGITPHKLRHTFASVLIAIGKDPIYVMSQLGHTDPAFTVRVYTHMMRRSPKERERLRALVEEGVLALDQPQTSHKSAKSGSQTSESRPVY